MADSESKGEGNLLYGVVALIVIVIVVWFAYRQGWFGKKPATTPGVPPSTGTTGTTPPGSGGTGGSGSGTGPKAVTITATSTDTSTQYWVVFDSDPGAYLGGDQWANAQPISDTIQYAGATLSLTLAPGNYWFSTTGGSTYTVNVNEAGNLLSQGTTTYGSTVPFTVS